jgi:hypothetical protein
MTERRLLEIVAAAGAHGINTVRLVERLYEDDPGGGPLGRTYHTHVHNLNRKLQHEGWRIACDGRGHGRPGTYRLVRTGPASFKQQKGTTDGK